MVNSCEICGSISGVQRHHIVKRSQGGKNNEENLIYLCWEHHHGTNGVHGKNGRKLDLQLKMELQKEYYSQGKTEKDVRKLMGGKIYLEDGEIYGHE